MNAEKQIEELEARIGELVEGNNALRAHNEELVRLLKADGITIPEEPKRRGRPPKNA